MIHVHIHQKLNYHIKDNNQLVQKIKITKKFIMLCFKNQKKHNHIKLHLYIQDNYHYNNHNNFLIENLNFLKVYVKIIKKIIIHNIIQVKLNKYLHVHYVMIILVVFIENISFKLIKVFMWHLIYVLLILMILKKNKFN